MSDPFEDYANWHDRELGPGIPREFIPNCITFPICALCGHVIWDWPHYKEEMEGEYCCDECCKKLDE